MARNVIQGSKKRTAEEVRWFNPETELESVYELRPLTKTAKETITDLRAEAQAVLQGAAERDDVPIAEAALTSDEDAVMIRNGCDQINALTQPTVDEQLPLGDVIFDQWERNLVVDTDVGLLAARLVNAAGKPSAS